MVCEKPSSLPVSNVRLLCPPLGAAGEIQNASCAFWLSWNFGRRGNQLCSHTNASLSAVHPHAFMFDWNYLAINHYQTLVTNWENDLWIPKESSHPIRGKIEKREGGKEGDFGLVFWIHSLQCLPKQRVSSDILEVLWPGSASPPLP